MNYKSFALIVAVVSIFVVGARAQSTITWASRGLPPGLEIVSVDPATGAAQISGTPTRAGAYAAVVYPLVNGFAGDMQEISFHILPAGVHLPVIYSYERRAPIKDGNFIPVCSGGDRIFGKVGMNRVAFSANGQDFILRSLPPGATDTQSLVTAATVGNTTLALFALDDSQNYMFGWKTPAAFSSRNASAFSAATLPFAAVQGWYQPYALTADDRSFFLVSLEGGYMSAGPAPTLTIWNRTRASDQWSMPASVPLEVDGYLYAAQSVGASLAHLRSNIGSIHVLVVTWRDAMSFAQSTLVMRSTDAGQTWTVVTGAPELRSITYDTRNARFVGSGGTGVWTSADGGISWRRVSTSNVGAVHFAASQNLLFSAHGGVSQDGANWLPYFEEYYIDESAGIFANATGSVVFRGSGYNGQQLSSTYVPTFWAERIQRGRVNAAFSYDLRVDD